jgi:hypothetical protein
MMRNLIITLMMSCVLLTACASPVGYSYEQLTTGGISPKKLHSTYRSPESSQGFQFPQSSQGYHGSLGKIKGDKIYDNNGVYKGSVNSSGNVYDQHKRPVYHEGPSPFSFDDAVDHVIKHGN